MTQRARPMVAAVGHVEWIEFLRVDRVPAAGEVVHGGGEWCEPAGGGAVAAVQLARLSGGATLFTALGDDENGHRSLARLRELGVDVHVAWRDAPTRRGVTLIDPAGERTIITIGERLAPHGEDPLPWPQLAAADGVYFTAGDAAALQAARQARVVAASPRARDALHAGIPIDALVLSAHDRDERREAERLAAAPPQARPSLVVLTEGPSGGEFRGREGEEGRWAAVPLPGARGDAYGCGDSFAAGVTFALASGAGVQEALDLGARCGATCLTGSGPYERQLGAADLGPG